MEPRRKIPGIILFVAVCGLVMGVAGFASSYQPETTHGEPLWAVGAFVFFLVGCVLGSLLERLCLGVGTSLRKVGNRHVTPLQPRKRRFLFERSAGWFFLCLGMGGCLGSLWSGTPQIWTALTYVSGGLGLILGVGLQKRILKLDRVTNDG